MFSSVLLLLVLQRENKREKNAPLASTRTCAHLEQMGPSEVSSRQKALRDPLERKQREMKRTAFYGGAGIFIRGQTSRRTSTTTVQIH